MGEREERQVSTLGELLNLRGEGKVWGKDAMVHVGHVDMKYLWEHIWRCPAGSGTFM